MAKKLNEKKSKLHIDNIYLTKKFNEEYYEAFQRFYEYVLKSDKSDMDCNVIVNIGIERCTEGMKENKKATMVIPKDKDMKDYVSKISKGAVFKEMKKKIRNQDYEKLHIASIWVVFGMCIVLFFLKNLMLNKFTVNEIVDSVVACIAGGLAFQNFMIKRRIINRYQFGNFYMQLDAATLIACIFVKFISESNFDVTYLMLVISFFITKKKIKPQFEQLI